LREIANSCAVRSFSGEIVIEQVECPTTVRAARKTWLAARPGYRKNTSVFKNTIGMRD